ncbi:PREDICTED: leucine-rich repeat-containing protein 17-like [Cyprinodon variegatus]|uniref:Leucine rich repeat containing 17 n=1 Tax=Cyprinodon variegatus TaxID=28743 RepID=A0A3Q2DMN0_CYPVA|nr:PREDICTED: leucine-rich repeat-containing protein 17-like [Cyprinodon variegatus]
MRLLTIIIILLLLQSAEPRKGGRNKAAQRGTKGRVRGRGRASLMKRQTQECKEYTEKREKFLDCQDRQLTFVNQDWPKDIQHLLLAKNKIQVLRNNMFEQFTKLKSLDLQQNAISVIEDNAFSGLDQLTTLLLQHNRIRTASEEFLLPLRSLSYLRIFDNPWSCRCPLETLVRTLQVPSNRNLGNYAKCAEPRSMKGKKLKELEAELLCAKDNRSEVLEGPEPGPVIEKSDAVSICNLKYPGPLLNCRHKGLNRMPPEMPLDLVGIDMSNNIIKHLRPKQFLLSKELKLLNLSSNKLEKIDTAAFAGLLHLRHLDLSNNSLRYFPYGVLEDLYFLRKLNLDNNPWMCDYYIHYLVYWLKHHPAVSFTGLICSEPEEFRGWRVEDYVKTYNGECPIDKQIEDNDNGQGAHGGSENEAQQVMGEMAEGQLDLLPQPIRKKEPNEIDIIRLS